MVRVREMNLTTILFQHLSTHCHFQPLPHMQSSYGSTSHHLPTPHHHQHIRPQRNVSRTQPHRSKTSLTPFHTDITSLHVPLRSSILLLLVHRHRHRLENAPHHHRRCYLLPSLLRTTRLHLESMRSASSRIVLRTDLEICWCHGVLVDAGGCLGGMVMSGRRCEELDLKLCRSDVDAYHFGNFSRRTRGGYFEWVGIRGSGGR